MSAHAAVEELRAGLEASRAEDRAEAVGAFCRRLMIDGEVAVPDEALEELRGRLLEDRARIVQRAAADALLWAAEWTDTVIPPAVVDAWCSVLDDGSRVECHAVVAQALGLTPTGGSRKRRVDLLRRWAAPGGPAEVRAAAVEALGRLSARSARGLLIAALEDAEPAVRRSAAAGLGFLGERRGVEGPLVTRLGAERDPSVRTAVVAALTRLGSRRCRATLLKLLSSSGTPQPDEVRIEILRALPVLYPEKLAEQLIVALTETSDAVREAAALFMVEQRPLLEEEGFEEILKEVAHAAEGRPEQAFLLWALHRWRCAVSGRGSLSEHSRRFDDFLEEYAEQALLSDPRGLGRRPAGGGGQ